MTDAVRCRTTSIPCCDDSNAELAGDKSKPICCCEGTKWPADGEEAGAFRRPFEWAGVVKAGSFCCPAGCDESAGEETWPCLFEVCDVSRIGKMLSGISSLWTAPGLHGYSVPLSWVCSLVV